MPFSNNILKHFIAQVLDVFQLDNGLQ